MSNEERLITERLKGIEYAIKVLNEEKDNLESELIDYQDYT